MPSDSPDTSASGQGRHDQGRETDECRPFTRMYDAITMPPAETLESSSDSVQDCIHQYDPAIYKLEHRPDDVHKVRFLSDAAKFTPPSTFKFQVTAGRKYNNSWEKIRLWLRYSVKSDGAYCAYCLCFGTVLNSLFVNQGSKNLKKAMGVNDGYLMYMLTVLITFHRAKGYFALFTV